MDAVRRDAERRDLARRIADEVHRRTVDRHITVTIERQEHEIIAAGTMNR
jgi:hypothetical protein